MKRAWQIMLNVVLAASVLTCVAQAQERVTLNVKTRAQIAGQTLTPGSYELAASGDRGIFTLADKSDVRRHVRFVNSIAMNDESLARADRPALQTARATTGALVITGVYFPESGLLYEFPVVAAKAAGEKEVASAKK